VARNPAQAGLYHFIPTLFVGMSYRGIYKATSIPRSNPQPHVEGPRSVARNPAQAGLYHFIPTLFVGMSYRGIYKATSIPRSNPQPHVEGPRSVARNPAQAGLYHFIPTLFVGMSYRGTCSATIESRLTTAGSTIAEWYVKEEPGTAFPGRSKYIVLSAECQGFDRSGSTDKTGLYTI
jgi:hypothetical protein